MEFKIIRLNIEGKDTFVLFRKGIFSYQEMMRGTIRNVLETFFGFIEPGESAILHREELPDEEN